MWTFFQLTSLASASCHSFSQGAYIHLGRLRLFPCGEVEQLRGLLVSWLRRLNYELLKSSNSPTDENIARWISTVGYARDREYWGPKSSDEG